MSSKNKMLATTVQLTYSLVSLDKSAVVVILLKSSNSLSFKANAVKDSPFMAAWRYFFFKLSLAKRFKICTPKKFKNCYIILFLNKQQKNYLTFHYVIYCPLIYVLKVYLKKLLVPRDNTPSHLETVMLANQLLYNQLGFALKIRFI